METDKMVSIWVGDFPSIEELESYVALTYDEEGEIVVSDFYKDFRIDIDDIDDTLIEKAVLESSSDDLLILLKGVSYEQKIMDEIVQFDEQSIVPSNTVLLQFNFHYEGNVTTSNQLNFVATVPYR